LTTVEERLRKGYSAAKLSGVARAQKSHEAGFQWREDEHPCDRDRNISREISMLPRCDREEIDYGEQDYPRDK
jgi:hypothetical protein